MTVINYYGPKIYKSLGYGDGTVVLIQGLFSAAGPITNILYVRMNFANQPGFDVAFI